MQGAFSTLSFMKPAFVETLHHERLKGIVARNHPQLMRFQTGVKVSWWAFPQA